MNCTFSVCIMFFVPRIERAVTEFTNQWNHDGLSTQGGRTPLQLWHTGVLSNPQILEDIGDFQNYGIDGDGPLPELQTNNNVIVPDISVSFNDTTMNTIRQVNPLENDGNHGIDVFASPLGVLQRT